MCTLLYWCPQFFPSNLTMILLWWLWKNQIIMKLWGFVRTYSTILPAVWCSSCLTAVLLLFVPCLSAAFMISSTASRKGDEWLCGQLQTLCTDGFHIRWRLCMYILVVNPHWFKLLARVSSVITKQSSKKSFRRNQITKSPIPNYCTIWVGHQIDMSY